MTNEFQFRIDVLTDNEGNPVPEEKKGAVSEELLDPAYQFLLKSLRFAETLESVSILNYLMTLKGHESVKEVFDYIRTHPDGAEAALKYIAPEGPEQQMAFGLAAYRIMKEPEEKRQAELAAQEKEKIELFVNLTNEWSAEFEKLYALSFLRKHSVSLVKLILWGNEEKRIMRQCMEKILAKMQITARSMGRIMDIINPEYDFERLLGAGGAQFVLTNDYSRGRGYLLSGLQELQQSKMKDNRKLFEEQMVEFSDKFNYFIPNFLGNEEFGLIGSS